MIRTIAALVLCACAPSAAAQECRDLGFAAGAFRAELSGTVGDGAPDCYTFGTGAGQTARLQLSASGNACFTVRGVVDCQTDYSFATGAGRYTVGVYQLLRSSASEDYTLRLDIR